MLEEVAEDSLGPRAVGAGDVRAADAGGRQRALQAVGGVVVKLLVLFRRPLPVADVRLVPDLPVPALDFAPGRTFRPSAAPTVTARATSRSPSADGPSRCRCGCSRDPAPVVLVRLRLGRQRFGHEADLDERLHLALDVSVEDAIDDRPVVDRPAGGVFSVGVGRSPFQRRRAVAGRQQVVRADEHGDGTERRQLREQLLAVLHVGVVRLVVAEERPHRRHRRAARVGVDPDRDAIAVVVREDDAAETAAAAARRMPMPRDYIRSSPSSRAK